MQTGRYEFDLTSINSMQRLRASREGLAEPIDWAVLDKSTLPPHAVVANGHGIASNIQGTTSAIAATNFPAAVRGRGPTSGTSRSFPDRVGCASTTRRAR